MSEAYPAPSGQPLGVTWTRRGFDATGENPDTVLAPLSGNLSAGGMLLLHDGPAAGRVCRRNRGR